MLVNCFTVKIVASVSETVVNELSNDFGANIPNPIPYEGGTLGFITYLFCVDLNVNVEEICKKYNCKVGNQYKMEIDPTTYNSNYTINNSYKKDGPKYHLKLVK